MKSLHESTTASPEFRIQRGRVSRGAALLSVLALVVLAQVASPFTALAATVWTGPKTTFTKAAFADPTQAANQDRITANVWLTRGSSQGPYNIKTEGAFGHTLSPADTEWAAGTTANYASLTYVDWNTWAQSLGGPPSTAGVNAVLHLKTDDIYIDIKFTSWGDGHTTLGGPFSYERSTPPAGNVSPNVSITNPPDNFSFSSPATVTIEVSANDTDGSVTNVEFFDGVVSLGSDPASPYSVSASLAPGLHTLTAVVSDNLGATTTSSPVHVTVAANEAPTVAITDPADGTAMSTPANVTVTADATDPGGSVASVQFFDGVTSLGTDTASPYSATANFYPGVHPLTAVAMDNLGLTTTSAVVSLTVTSTPIANPIVDRIPKGDLTIELNVVADGMAAPLGMTVPDDGSGRMFVHDQDGRVWIVTSAGRMATPLLDVRNRLVLLGAYDERGLLGMAVHPNFAGNPLIYTYTSETNNATPDFATGLGAANNHQSVIAEWRISAGNSNVVDVASRREILRIDQPQSNHNGGAMHFGPDGKLYIVLGDGGSANDVAAGHVPGGNAQDLNRIWGKMLRLDVDARTSVNGQYGVPTDNPFVGTDGIDEIWAYGLRNPFSFNFELGTTNLYLADVGQNKVEEVDIITKGGNYGWNVREATFWFDGAGNIVTAPVRPVPPNLIDPIAQYDHDDGLAIICGFVYHGSAIPALQGRFVFGDWGAFTAPSGRLFHLDAANNVKELRIGGEDRPLGMWLRGYGEDADGEVYVLCSRQLGPTGNTGRMLKLVPVPAAVMLTSLAPSNGTNIVTTWSGGTGPYALQKKATLTEATWQNAAFSSTATATAAADTTAGFFRTLDVAKQHRIPLTAYLSGPNSPGWGTAIFSLDGNILSFNIRYSGLSSVANNAHIHGPASTSQSAGVLIPLVPSHVGALSTNGVFTGSLTITDAQRALILAGKTYVNIHTVNFGGGEIRGQLAPVAMQVALSSPSNPAASGLGTLTLVHTQLTLNVTYRGLSSPATMAHIHGPATASGSAGVLVDLAPVGAPYGSGGNLSGTVALTPTQLGHLIDGLTYINFHTAANPGGELRGQILPHATAVPLTVLLTGEAERPPVTTGGTGNGTFLLEGNTLSFNLAYSGLSGVANNAHIHGVTNTTQSAGVLVPLGPFNGGAYGTAGTFSGSVALTVAQRDAILNGLTYVNIHTPANGGGEIRGQIAPVLMWAWLSGLNERNTAAVTPATGSGTFALVRNQLTLNVTYRDLLSPATASHIHGPGSFLQSAGVLVGLDSLNGGGYGTAGGLSGTVSLVTSNLLSVIDGSTYVNFHTTNYSGGEIRGQILR